MAAPLFREWVEGLVRDLMRTELESGDPAVVRRATVTALNVAGDRVRTSVTGDAWLQFPLWWTPTDPGDIGTVVEVLEQGPGYQCVLTVLTP